VKVGDGKAIFERMLREGVIVRPMNGYPLPEWVRISVGTMEQNRRCIASLRKVLAA
jgi:histidinol-phosphate aminotransferase